MITASQRHPRTSGGRQPNRLVLRLAGQTMGKGMNDLGVAAMAALNSGHPDEWFEGDPADWNIHGSDARFIEACTPARVVELCRVYVAARAYVREQQALRCVDGVRDPDGFQIASADCHWALEQLETVLDE